MRSGFIPRFVGIAAIIAGSGYVIASSITLFLPAFAQWGQLAMILGVGELTFIWMLIWGAKEPPPNHPRLEPTIA